MNHSEIVSFIWSVADLIGNAFERLRKAVDLPKPPRTSWTQDKGPGA